MGRGRREEGDGFRLFLPFIRPELDCERRLLLLASHSDVIFSVVRLDRSVGRRDVFASRKAAPLNYPSYLLADVREGLFLEAAKRIISITGSCHPVYTYVLAGAH